MRISDVTKDNYKDYLRLFGIKDTNSLDKDLDKALGINEYFDHSYEGRNARLVADGHEDGMLIPSGDNSWKKIVPVSPSIRNTLLEVTKRQFLDNGNGMAESKDGDEIGAIMKGYRKNIPAKDRLSVTYTLRSIVQSESQRLVDFVKANNPTWTYGQAFDKSIFDNYTSGGVDIVV